MTTNHYIHSKALKLLFLTVINVFITLKTKQKHILEFDKMMFNVHKINDS